MWRKKSFMIRRGMLEEFEVFLKERESAKATISKYRSDIKVFMEFMGTERRVTKQKLIEYKDWLAQRYALSSANSMLVALNQFLDCLGMGGWKVRRFKVQPQCFRAEEKEMTGEEYRLLRETAKKQGKEQLALIMETIAGTGIRIAPAGSAAAPAGRRKL